MPGARIECERELFHAPESCRTENIRSKGPMRAYVIGGAAYVACVVRLLPGKGSRRSQEPR